jgi:methylated-DNA-[protein]-cysteine S-methyltransferase
MIRTAHHWFIFETALGFCGITWNSEGIARFQLPARTAEATERNLQRRLTGAAPGAPPPGVIDTIAAARRDGPAGAGPPRMERWPKN